MHATRPRSRRLLPRVGLALFALVGWLGAQAAAIAHVPGKAGGCAHHGGRTAPAGESRCGHVHAHLHAHETPPTPSPDDDERAPDHDADRCALCAHAAVVVDVPVDVVTQPPVGGALARAPAPFVAPTSAPRFEPGLARGPPTLPRS